MQAKTCKAGRTFRQTNKFRTKCFPKIARNSLNRQTKISVAKRFQNSPEIIRSPPFT